MVLLDIIMPTIPDALRIAQTLGLDQIGYWALPVSVFLNFIVNFALVLIVLAIAKKLETKSILQTAPATAGATLIVFIVELLDPTFGVVSTLVILALYFWVFKSASLSLKQALAAAIVIALLTNPFVYAILLSNQGQQPRSREWELTVKIDGCQKKLAQNSKCYKVTGEWNPAGRVNISEALACLQVPTEFRHPNNGNCGTCSYIWPDLYGSPDKSGFCFDDVNNPAYVCCGLHS